MADPAVPEQLTARADKLVVVQGHDHRDALVATGVQHGRGDQREGVVHVHDIGAVSAQLPGKVPAGHGVVQRLRRQRGLAGQGPRRDVVAVPFEPRHEVTGSGQGGGLLVDDVVLTAGSSGAVAPMDEQDLHLRRILASGTSRATATLRSSRYGDASPMPVSVTEAIRQ